jgi:RNA polymerase sigma factor (sigma-70 family)
MTPIEPTDSELLTSYAVDGSEAAFGQLVRRHLGLVYSAALRQLGGGSASAEDVAQLVFTVLAREADGLRRRDSIAGWLHTTTRHLSAKARRSDERRLLRETTALAMNPTDDTAAWEEMSPILDTALHELPDNDREAVLLRFFEKLSLSEVGSRLGVGEDAARKRVDRALDKLRGLLAKRGVTSATAAALAALLLDRASAAPPIQLAAEATATALKAAATVASGGLLAWFLGWPAKVALVAGIVAVVASVAIQSHHSGKSADRWQSAALDGFQAASSASRGITPSIPSNGDTASAPAFTEPDGQQKMLFQVISKTSGQPLPHATVFVEHTSENGTYASKTLHTDTNGYCKIFYPFGTATLLVSCRTDGCGVIEPSAGGSPKRRFLLPTTSFKWTLLFRLEESSWMNPEGPSKESRCGPVLRFLWTLYHRASRSRSKPSCSRW